MTMTKFTNVFFAVSCADPDNEEHLDRFLAYCTSLYWSVTVVSTTGYGDILPESEFEKCTSYRHNGNVIN